MNSYNGAGVEDDRLARAAQRIVRQYHLEQSDRSEDSVSTPVRRADGARDNIHEFRLALDEMGLKIEHMQRLMANREALFMAALERLERNLAKTDGRVDALSSEVARIDARPELDREANAEEQRATATALMQEWTGMMALGRALLDEVREFHGTAIPGVTQDAGAGIVAR